MERTEVDKSFDACFVVVDISVPSLLSLSLPLSISLSPPLRFTFARSQFHRSSPRFSSSLLRKEGTKRGSKRDVDEHQQQRRFRERRVSG